VSHGMGQFFGLERAVGAPGNQRPLGLRLQQQAAKG